MLQQWRHHPAADPEAEEKKQENDAYECYTSSHSDTSDC